MIQEFIFMKVTEYLAVIRYFPGVIYDNAAVSVGSAAFFASLITLFRSRTPIFRKAHFVRFHVVCSQATPDDSGAMLLVALFGLWATYQYQVHGDPLIVVGMNGVLFAFFGQIYVIFTGFQAGVGVGLFGIIKACAKLIAATAALTTTAVLMANSSSYWHQLPPDLTKMNFADFIRNLPWFISHYGDWLEFMFQQAMGIVSRYLITFIALAIVTYHVAVRFPEFCDNNPRLYRNLSAFNSVTSYVGLLMLSFISNDLLKGTLFQNLELLRTMLVRLLFTA